MAYPAPKPEQLSQIRSLNWLFLTFLQTSLRHDGPTLGLTRSLRPALRAATPPQIELAATFPRALFCLELDGLPVPLHHSRLYQEHERAREALTLTALLTAWNLSRQSDYQSRLFLGLDDASIRRLRQLQLTELPALAGRRGLLRCGFREAESLWLALLSQRGQALQRELRLIAMQPATSLRNPADGPLAQLLC